MLAVVLTGIDGGSVQGQTDPIRFFISRENNFGFVDADLISKWNSRDGLRTFLSMRVVNGFQEGSNGKFAITVQCNKLLGCESVQSLGKI